MMQVMNQAILSHVITQINMGKIRYCENLGFTHDELMTIKNLTTDELHHLSQMTCTFLNINVDHELLRKMLERIKIQSAEQRLFDRALVLGASIELMRYFFGAQPYEVSERRRLLGKQISAGRRTISDIEKSSEAWYRWQEACKLDQNNRSLNSLIALDNLMAIAEELNLDLAMLWKQVKKWENFEGE